jgi:protein-S-isoprenylcysteine O-methyltransferase Ste14
VGLQFCLIAILAIVPIADPIWQFSAARNLAIAMYFLAILIFAFAARALQPSLRINPIPKPGAPLITNGIYKYLRHPMYLAVMIIATGLLIQKIHPLSLIIWLALGTNMSLKARYEDVMLREIHTSAKNYQEKSRFLRNQLSK